MRQTGRYTIAFRDLREGRHEFHFQVDTVLFRAFDNEEIHAVACETTVVLERTATSMQLNAVIDGEVTVACDRCLEDVCLPVHFEGTLPVMFSDEEHEWDGETLWLLRGENEIDLSQYLYESVVLSLPVRRVHPDGQCNPEMLARFETLPDEEDEETEE